MKKVLLLLSNGFEAVDVAFLLLERLTSKSNCNEVKKLMGF